MMTDKRYYSEKKISSSKNMRIFQNAMGISMMIIGGLGLFAYIGSPSDFNVVDLLLYVATGIGGIVLFVFGKKRKKLIENCLQYVQYMEVQGTIEISELSIRMGRSEEIILKQLGELLKKQYFVNMIIDYSTNQIKMLAKSAEEKINTGCETVIRDKNSSDLERNRIQQEVEDNDVIRIHESVNGNEKLKVYKDRFEVVLIRNKQEVTVAYHYYNVKSICADKFMKGDRIAIKMADDNELSFFLNNASMEEYQELATLLSELKENAPTMEELGVSAEEALKELKDNKEKSKYELTKKIGKFISEYKQFKELELMNKVLHLAVPIICLILLFNILGGGQGSKQDYIDCAKTVVSRQLRSPSTAMFYGEEILDEDKYGRVLVRICVEAQNGFGGYVKNTFVIVISDYNKATEEFITSGRILSYNVDEEWLADAFVEQAKTASNWGEPLSEDEKF